MFLDKDIYHTDNQTDEEAQVDDGVQLGLDHVHQQRFVSQDGTQAGDGAL